MTRDELLDRLQVLLGGRVSEEVIFGDISTGALNDLQRASDIACSMVMEYGMSERLGLLTYTRQPQSRYLDLGLGSGEREYSERTAQEIDEEKSRIIEEAHQKVLLKLKNHRDSLEKLAGILLEKESIEGDDPFHPPLTATLAHATVSTLESSFLSSCYHLRKSDLRAIRHTGAGRAPQYTCTESSTHLQN